MSYRARDAVRGWRRAISPRSAQPYFRGTGASGPYPSLRSVLRRHPAWSRRLRRILRYNRGFAPRDD